MTMQELLNSLFIGVFGMSVVFVALILLILLISLQPAVFNRLSGRSKRLAARKASSGQPIPALPSVPAPAAFPTHQPAPPSLSQDLQLIDVDDKTAAIIMAIVCDHLGCVPEELYFKSIRLLEK